jgi:hypothetical protein
MRDGKKYRFTGAAQYRGARVGMQQMEYGIIDKKELGFKHHAQGYVYISLDGERLALMTWDGKHHTMEMLERVTGGF